MRKTRVIKVNMNNAEKLLKGNSIGKIYLSEEGKKLLATVVKEKRG